MTKKMSGPPGKRLIWRAYVTKKGKRVYASQYGLRAFPLWVDV